MAKLKVAESPLLLDLVGNFLKTLCHPSQVVEEVKWGGGVQGGSGSGHVGNLTIEAPPENLYLET